MNNLLERVRDSFAGRYAVDRELGRGGMAVVYLAADLKHQREVAIKVLLPELSATLGAERFLREIEIAASLQHPHILPLYDSGEASGLLFYVMPVSSGESLRHRLDREQLLSIDDSVRIGVEIADALDYAHSRGIVHRDIKPANILVSDSHAVVMDFGIAKALEAANEQRLTSTGLAVGTPLYASPEQAAGQERTDGRSDIYSLACVLYEVLAGDPPLTGASAQATQARRLAEVAPSLVALRKTVPRRLDNVILRALATDAADRYATAGEFARALQDAVSARMDYPSGPSRPSVGSSAVRPRTRWPRRRRMALVFALVAIIGMAIWVFLQRSLQTDSPLSDAIAPSEIPLELEGIFGQALFGGTGSYSISPDGRWLAYCSRETEDEVLHRLWLADLSDLARPHRVLASGESCWWVRWTPTGERILFNASIQGQSAYYAVSRDGGSARPFLDCPDRALQTDEGAPVLSRRWAILSPDEEMLAFNANDPDHFRIGVSTGCEFVGDTVRLDGELLYVRPRAWSSRGDRVLVETEDAGGVASIWIVDLESHMPNLVSEGGAYYPMNWSAAGRAVYHISGPYSGGIVRIPVDSLGQAVRGSDRLAYFDANPVDWFSMSDDGHRAIVARGATRYRVVRVLPDPSAEAIASVVPVTDTITGWGAFAVSRDGQWIAFDKRVPEGSDLFKTRVADGTPQRLTRSGVLDGSEWPAWSPEDDYIAYSGYWRGTLRLWLVRADGTGTGTVSGVLTNDEYPFLMWEGLDLHYARIDFETERISDLRFEVGQWTDGRWRPAPAGAPDVGDFVVEATRDILRDSVDDWEYSLVFPSPDDRLAVARCSSRALGEYWCQTSPQGTLLLMPFSYDEHPVGWDDDGSAFYWQVGNEIYRWHIAGGDRDLVATLPDSLNWIRLNLQAGAPCQRRRGQVDLEFICAIDESRPELFMVDNFDPDVQ